MFFQAYNGSLEKDSFVFEGVKYEKTAAMKILSLLIKWGPFVLLVFTGHYIGQRIENILLFAAVQILIVYTYYAVLLYLFYQMRKKKE